MDEISEFGTIVLIVGAGVSLALIAHKLTERLPVPAPGLFLLAAAIAAELFPGLVAIDIRTVERIGVVALVVILLDGGMHVGLRRFRASAIPITILGVIGTFLTAGIMAVAAHALGFSWITSWLIGAALAPTDPAVMFSVLGNREVGGRTGTILEGESGANDPVGIALMIGILEYATTDGASVWLIVEEFGVEMIVGLVVGLVGARALLWLMQHVSLPREGLYPLRVLAIGAVIYGAASLLHGSGFLAVFVAGLLIGDEAAPYKREIESFHTSLASLAEIAVFVALGLTISLDDVGSEWADGLVLALVLALVARPLAVGLLLIPARLRVAERLFVMWGGLKGAVPILLAAFVLLAGVQDAREVYLIVFVVVLFSVLVQGTTIPLVARRLSIPMRTVQLDPWDYSIRLRTRPEQIRSFVVSPASRVVGRAIRDLPLGEDAWISLVVHDGAARHPRGSYELEVGDEVHVLAKDDDLPALERLFERE